MYFSLSFGSSFVIFNIFVTYSIGEFAVYQLRKMYSMVKGQRRKINHALAETLHLLQGTISSGGCE